MRLRLVIAGSLAIAPIACGKQKGPPAAIPPQPPPVSTHADDDGGLDDGLDDDGFPPSGAPARPSGSKAATAKPKATHTGKKGALTVGTLNLNWAHGPGKAGSKAVAANRAQTDADWTWKRDAVATVLAREALAVVAVTEVGGQSELQDIAATIKAKGGPQYNVGWVATKDSQTGHHVGILSRFPVKDARRFDIFLRRHVAAQLDLPGGQALTVVAVHGAEGGAEKRGAARRKQAKALKRAMNTAAKDGPVLVLGTLGSKARPGDKGYAASSVGLLAGANTGRKTDDCIDSAGFEPAQETAVGGGALDRIVACGLDMTDARVAARKQIVRKEPDGAKAQWPAVAAAERDVSDHFVLRGAVSIRRQPATPKTPASPTKKGKADKKATPANKGKPGKKAAPANKGKADKKATPAKKGKADKKATPAKKGKADKKATPAKKGKPDKKATPAKKGKPDKKPAPTKKPKPDKKPAPAKKAKPPAKKGT